MPTRRPRKLGAHSTWSSWTSLSQEGWGGMEAMSILLTMDPDATAIVSSGYSDNPMKSNYAPYGFRGVIPKPYRIEDMVAEIERVISKNRRT
jgi:hypothetical protein